MWLAGTLILDCHSGLIETHKNFLNSFDSVSISVLTHTEWAWAGALRNLTRDVAASIWLVMWGILGF